MNERKKHWLEEKKAGLDEEKICLIQMKKNEIEKKFQYRRNEFKKNPL